MASGPVLGLPTTAERQDDGQMGEWAVRGAAGGMGALAPTRPPPWGGLGSLHAVPFSGPVLSTVAGMCC